MDGADKLYIADPSIHRVHEVDRAGRITTIARNGVRGFSGDGGSAAAGQRSGFDGLALDAIGNLCLTDLASVFLVKGS